MTSPSEHDEITGPIRWKITELTSLAKQVDPVLARPGLYVVHFANGDAWVGTTVDLPAPFSVMRRRWPEDIEAVEYVPALLHEVEHAKESIISALTEHGSRLRNALLEGLAPSPVLFDRTVDPVAQTGWIIGEMVLLDPADRAALAAHRTAADDYDVEQVLTYGRLAESDAFQSAFLAAATYVDVAIPAADLTEDRWWSLVVLPDEAAAPGGEAATAGDGGVRRLVSLRVGGTEVFAVVEASSGEQRRAIGYLHLAPGTELPHGLRERVATVTVEDGDCGPVEVLRLPVQSPDEAVLILLDEPDVLLGARWLVLDLMRRGSGALRHDHNVPMADALFGYMEDVSQVEDELDDDDAQEGDGWIDGAVDSGGINGVEGGWIDGDVDGELGDGGLPDWR